MATADRNGLKDERCEARHLEHIVDKLSSTYGRHSRETVERVVRDELAAFAGARVRDFVPVLVERRSRERLKSAAPLPPGGVSDCGIRALAG